MGIFSPTSHQSPADPLHRSRHFLQIHAERDYICKDAEHPSILNIDKRTIINIEEKRRIAAAALSLIPEGSSVLFDSGTTTSSLAEQLAASGIRPDIGLTASSPYLVSIKKQMLKASKKVVVLLDSSKFFVNSINLFCEFDPKKIHTIITVKNEKNYRQIENLEQRGIQILLA
ncbi:MAG: DeoR/GlpR transcriptional regulator [Lachnospiraceae bacterium]|nr:DeoR/GlpR transcriptional regulator [Lachnospiraceae bacterium]